jgi:hypothetical protein
MKLEGFQPRLVPWLEPPQMDFGAPMPAVHSDGNRLICAYYISEQLILNGASAVLQFEGVLQFRLGYPNDEALHGHPLSGLGLESYRFYVVENSPTIAEIENQNRAHSGYKAGMYARFRHWIVTFHDETLEVIALRGMVVGQSQLSPNRAVCVA